MPQASLADYRSGSDDAQQRRMAVAVLDRFCDDRLPDMAAEHPDEYPVRFQHCWRRLAYDRSLKTDWRERVEQPFVENAPLGAVQRAAGVASRLAVDPPRYAWVLQESSLLYRGEIDPAECDHVDPATVLDQTRTYP